VPSHAPRRRRRAPAPAAPPRSPSARCGSDHPGGDAVDARVEKSSRPRSGRARAADDLVRDGLGLVVQQHHMIAVPTHAAAELEENCHPPKPSTAGQLATRLRSGGSVRCPSTADLRLCVRQVELVGADRVALAPIPKSCPPRRPGGSRGDRDFDHLVQASISAGAAERSYGWSLEPSGIRCS